MTWDDMGWDDRAWDVLGKHRTGRDEMRWDGMRWNDMKRDGTRWDGMRRKKMRGGIGRGRWMGDGGGEGGGGGEVGGRGGVVCWAGLGRARLMSINHPRNIYVRGLLDWPQRRTLHTGRHILSSSGSRPWDPLSLPDGDPVVRLRVCGRHASSTETHRG